jgi:hypothetical protein
MSTEPTTPDKPKRTRSTAGFTPDKMEYKICKTVDENLVEAVIKGANLEYINSAGKYLPQLFSATGDLTLVNKDPTEIIKELLNKGALDKDLCLTEKEGDKKTSLKDALLNLKSSEELNAQPNFTPTITPVEPVKTDPNSDSVKSLAEIFENWVAKDAKFMNQVMEANEINSIRISANEVAMLRKHFEDEQYKLYVTKTNMTGVNAKNGWDLAQGAKKVITKKITEVYRDEADKPVSTCKVEDLATSAYLRLTRIMSSSKVDAMARAAKHDEKLGYLTVPLTINFGTLEDKNVFKEKARDLGLNSKDSFPKLYAKQRDMSLNYFKNSVIFNNKSIWAKADVRLGRPEDPICISIQTKKAETADRWENKAKIQLLPNSTWGRLSQDQKEAHIKKGCE